MVTPPQAAKTPLPLAGRGRGWGSAITARLVRAVTPPLSPPRQGEGKSPRRPSHVMVRAGLLGIAILVCGGIAALGVIWQRMEPLPLARAEALSVTVLDRNDRLLRAYTTPDGRWRLPIDPKDVDARYLAMLLAFEDKRFRSHHGVDPWAVGRAVLAARPPRPHRLGRVHAHHAGRAPRPGRARAQRSRQDQAGAARAGARAAPVEGRDPAALSAARALRRQPRGGEGRLARLFRQGAAAAVAGGGGAAGCPAAGARVAPAEPLSGNRAPRAQPRARLCRRGRRDPARGCDAGHDRAHAGRAPRVSDPGAAPFRRRGRARQGPQRPSPDHRRDPPGQPRAARARARQHAGRAPVRGADRGRPQDRRGHRARRLARLPRRGPLRRRRHDQRHSLAGLDAEAVRLRPRLRGGARASRDADRGPAVALRPLCAEELRYGLARHRHHPHGARPVAEYSGREGAGGAGARQAHGAADPGRRRAGAAQGRRAEPWRSRSAGSVSSSPTWPRSMRASLAAASRSPSSIGATCPSPRLSRPCSGCCRRRRPGT